MAKQVSVHKSSEFLHHIQRLRAGTVDRYSALNLPRWITENTYINGEKYSFKDHEYQERIALDQSIEVNIMKCSQVGISELAARIALAFCAVQQHYTVAYTLPTAGFAGTFMRTRIDPVIQGSPYLTGLIHNTTDNAEIKRLGDSYLYLKGSQSNNAPISVPCDHLIHDEFDFSDPDVVSQYQSRLSHSKFRRKHRFSTPTSPNRGIHKEFLRSRRFHNLVKCEHCNHYFKPDYFTHVRIPGSETVDIRLVKKDNLHHFDYNHAYLECPKCKKRPSLQLEHREWVCENPDEPLIAAGYHVTPFDAPNIIALPYLIHSSTQYKSYIDFENFGLGLPAEDRDTTLTRQDLEGLIIPFLDPTAYGSYVMGLDMGMTCHCVIGFLSADGAIIIVHTEQIPAAEIRVRRRDLAKKFRVRMTVVDSLPYTETVLSMQNEDKNLFGAVYTREKGLELYRIKDQDENRKEGKAEVRQVNIARDKSFDSLMDTLKSGLMQKVSDENDQAWIDQLCDMKRSRKWTPEQEMTFVWEKSEEGNDHFHHATNYMWIASQLVGVATHTILLPTLIHKYNTTPLKKPIK